MGSASSSASAASSLHMAMAALVGSSIMAVSAFYIHKRSVDQVLHRLTERRRNVGSRSYIQRTDDDEEEVEDEEEEEDGEFDDEAEFGSDYDLVAGRKIGGRGFSRSVDEKFVRNYRMSSSLPNVALANRDWVQEGSNFGRGSNFRAHEFSSSLDKLNYMPFGLPPLRTDQRHGKCSNFCVICFSFWFNCSKYMYANCLFH